ncbi:MAG: hypothetical protein P4L87_13610 [Formivibrio sp.]|nr:hypothetical protein [Formivibrio sp.]
MSADQADRFEEAPEGENFGDLDDWEAELAEKILRTGILLKKASDAGANAGAAELLEKKLVVYNAALDMIHENPKAAAMEGSKGGLKAICLFLKKQAADDAAKMETRKYSDQIMQKLPGYQLSKKLGLQLQPLIAPGAWAAAGQP